MEILKLKNIKKRYTEIIKEYLKDGYVFNIETMNGCQLEMAKVHLSKENEILNVWIENNSYSFDEPKIKIIVEKYDKTKTYGTLWNKKGEMIYTEIFYVIAKAKNDFILTRDYNFYSEIINKKNNRLMNNYNHYGNEILLNIDAKNVLKFVNNRKGYKTTKAKDIKEITKTISKRGIYYTIRFKDYKKKNINIGFYC